MSKLDPLASLIDYVNTVKPYHSKIYEILLQYVHKENVGVSVAESYQIHTTVVNPESDVNVVCPGVGWDTQPWDIGMYDFPLICNDTSSPSGIRTSVTESMQIDVLNNLGDLAFTYVEDHTQPIGWDMVGWDHTTWDGPTVDNWVVIEEGSATTDPVGATITESLTIQVI